MVFEEVKGAERLLFLYTFLGEEKCGKQNQGDYCGDWRGYH